MIPMCMVVCVFVYGVVKCIKQYVNWLPTQKQRTAEMPQYRIFQRSQFSNIRFVKLYCKTRVEISTQKEFMLGKNNSNRILCGMPAHVKIFVSFSSKVTSKYFFFRFSLPRSNVPHCFLIIRSEHKVQLVVAANYLYFY